MWLKLSQLQITPANSKGLDLTGSCSHSVTEISLGGTSRQRSGNGAIRNSHSTNRGVGKN